MSIAEHGTSSSKCPSTFGAECITEYGASPSTGHLRANVQGAFGTACITEPRHHPSPNLGRESVIFWIRFEFELPSSMAFASCVIYIHWNLIFSGIFQKEMSDRNKSDRKNVWRKSYRFGRTVRSLFDFGLPDGGWPGFRLPCFRR